MKRVIVAMAVLLAANVSATPEETVRFSVTVKHEGQLLGAPSFLAYVGRPASMRFGEGMAVEALAEPFDAEGRAWTKVRITTFETEDSQFVQEMRMRHRHGLRTGSFEYTDGAKRRYVILVGK